MRISFTILLTMLVFSLMNSTVNAQEKVHWDVVAQIREEGFERSQVAEYTSYLSDVIGPRLTASANMREAQQWTKTKMDEIGLINTVIEPFDAHCVSWEVEYLSVHMLEPDYQMVIGYPLAFTPGTAGKIVAEAMIVDIKTKTDLEQYRGKLNNAVILATPPMPMNPRFTQDAFRHTDESLKAFATQGIDILYQQHGRGQAEQSNVRREGITSAEMEAFFKAEEVAVVLNAGMGGDGTVLVTGRPTSRNDRSIEGVRNSVPMLNVAAEHYNRMYRILERSIPVKMEVEVRIKMDDRDTQGYNVVGELPGTDLADEIVMIGGHMDTWHAATGASDNAGGVSVALEALRILKAIGVKPRRTIRIGLWSYEEGGLKGSRGYVKQHLGNPRDGEKPDYDNFSVYFNMDNGAGQFRGIHLQGNPQVAPIFEAWMKPFADLQMDTLSIFSNTGTDHLAFDEAGLPGFQFLQDRIDYRARTWHYNMDFFDHVVVDDLKINAVIMASFAYHAAMRDEKIPRKIFTN